MVAMQSQMSELMQMMTRLQPPKSRQEYAQVGAKSPLVKMQPVSISAQQDKDNCHKDVLLPLKQCSRYQSGPSKVKGVAAIPDDKERNVELHAAIGQSNPKAIPENKNDQEFKVVNRNRRNRHSHYMVGTDARKEGVRHN